MSGVFQIIDPPHPLTAPDPPGECVPQSTPPPLVRGRTHTLGGEGVGDQYLEDARHSSVLYICKYFVVAPMVEARTPLTTDLYSFNFYFVVLKSNGVHLNI